MMKNLNLNKLILTAVLSLYCVLLPFEEILIFSFGSILKIVGILLIALSILFYPKIKLNKMFIWLVIWLMYCGISVIWADSFSSWSYFFKIYAGQVLFLLILANLPKHLINIKTVFSWQIIGAIIGGLCLLFLPSSTTYIEGRRTLIFFGNKMDPNILSSIFIVAIYCLIYFIHENKKKGLKNIFIYLEIILLITCIAFTGSRGAIISFCFSMLVLILLYLKKSKGIVKALNIIIICSISIALLAVLIPSDIIDNRFNMESIFGLDEYYSGVHNRYTIWRYSWEVFLQKPFFGYGCGNFFEAISQVYIRTASHNIIVLEVVENGIIGCIPLFIFLFILLKKVLKQNYVLFALLIAIYVMSLTLDSLPYKYFWVSIFLACYFIKNKENENFDKCNNSGI